MENQKDRTLIYQTRPEFEFIGETVTVLEFIEGIFKTIGYTALESNDNYIDENGDPANILSLNKFLNNIRYWDMEVVFLKNQNKITFPIEPNDAPSMWDMLHYFQKIFKFSCKFGSLSDVSPTVKVICPGHYYAKDFTLPLSHGINSAYQSLKESISITDSKLLSDIPVKKGIVKDSMAINQSYIDILLYTDPTTTEKPETINLKKEYGAVKYKSRNISLPEHFVFIENDEPGNGLLPFVLQTEFSYILERFSVIEGVVSIYDRWMNWQDYESLGIYSAGVELPPINKLESRNYLVDYSAEFENKMVENITYLPANGLYEIKQSIGDK